MWTHFGDLQFETLRTALDRIIPADEYPGAWDAGCGEYISRQLNGQLAYLLPAYRAGLDGLEAEAMRQFGNPFAGLAPEQQDAILAHAETGEVEADWDTSPKLFFSTLVNHAAEGYYADPGQGGNRDRVSWRMIGFHGK